MLNALPDIGGKRYVRHVRLERPLCAYVDGTRGVAVLMQTDVS